MKKTSQYLVLGSVVALFTGCATTAPNELVKARSAYQLASQGPAQELAPAELHKAHEALTRAEQSFQHEPKSVQTKDLAYIAERKSQQAGALGSLAASRASKDGANSDFQSKQAELVTQGKQDLRDADDRTVRARAELERKAEIKAAKDQADAEQQRQQAVIAQGKQDLNDSEMRAATARAEIEKQAAMKAAKDQADAEYQMQQAQIAQGKQDLHNAEKLAAEKQAELDKQAAVKAANDQALASLASLASLKEEQRGLVLTLTGSVLFGSAQSTLMPSARAKLDQVATALLAINARNLVVEGHTDSKGTDAYNQNLSQLRSNAVREYLVQRGYPANRIQSQGRGEGSPITKNDSPDGRANNRRVEIVIERETK